MKRQSILITMIIAVVLVCACISSPTAQNDTMPSEPVPPTIDPEFCGTSTNAVCATDSDCKTGGCSGQVCMSKDDREMITTCEYRECYSAKKYSVSCRCTQNKCQWTSIHAQ